MVGGRTRWVGRMLSLAALSASLAVGTALGVHAQGDEVVRDFARSSQRPTKAHTWCNPLNLDYAYAPRRDAPTPGSAHRSTADPACVAYKGEYFLASTNQEGYWMSSDLLTWRFIRHEFARNANNDEVCAPAAWPTSKGLLFLPSFENCDMPLYLSTDPAHNVWTEVLASFAPKTWDPALFQDQDGRLYLYWGSSSRYPLYGVELDPSTYKPLGNPVELISLHPKEHGWEVFGQDNRPSLMPSYLEGAWVNRFGNRYYLQYAAPGTELNVYGDGVYTSSSPLGPYTYQQHNPFSSKPTGFVRGAGHGSTLADAHGNLWHLASMVIGVKHKFERRLGLFPAGVDSDGVLFCDTAFGDYPHYMPHGKQDPSRLFTGWMLLSYHKKTWAAASLPGHEPKLAADEDIRTWWSAPDGASGRWLAMDLGKVCKVRAVQVNFADEQSSCYGKQDDARCCYRLEGSTDKVTWFSLADKSRSTQDTPHDYVELHGGVAVRYLRVVCVRMPSGFFAISDLRVFGKASGQPPGQVRGLEVRRDPQDARHATLMWKPVRKAYAYEIRYGISPTKLYSSILVYGATAYETRALDTDTSYWFSVRAVGEAGVSRQTSELVETSMRPR
jgi:xylan 1,4-beta-xylosidase